MAEGGQEVQIKPVRHAITLSKYSGEKGSSPAQHLAAFSIAAKANGWDEDLKLIQFPGTLTKFSLSWYLATTEKRVRNDEEWTWEELRNEFLWHGTQGLFAMDLEFLLMDRKQREEETCLEYMYAVEQLILQIDDQMAEDKRVKYIKRGLLSENFKRVNLVPCRTMDDLASLLQNLDEAVERERREQLKEDVELAEEDVFKGNSKPQEKEVANETIKELQERLRRLEMRQDRPSTERNRQEQQGARYQCRGYGYRGGQRNRSPNGNRIRQLEMQPHPQEEPHSSGRRDFKCYACDQPGHFARDCRKQDSKNGYGRGTGVPRGRTYQPEWFTRSQQ